MKNGFHRHYKTQNNIKEVIMKANHLNRGILVAAIVALVGFSGIALASPYGGGRHMGYGYNDNDCPRFQEGRRGGADLNDEQVAQVEKLRDEFHQATAELRSELRQKELALQAELAKKSPDSAAAAGLQKDISALRADLDAKRLAHRLEVQKIVPEAGSGYGMGPRHGRGSRGPCWN
jgi:Spy/CpxP family protein refolding chaperone